jgi:hypothetical protein
VLVDLQTKRLPNPEASSADQDEHHPFWQRCAAESCRYREGGSRIRPRPLPPHRPLPSAEGGGKLVKREPRPASRHRIGIR